MFLAQAERWLLKMFAPGLKRSPVMDLRVLQPEQKYFALALLKLALMVPVRVCYLPGAPLKQRFEPERH